MAPDEIERQMQAHRREALEHFPLKLIETTGDKALETWQALKSAGQGSPVILGADELSTSFDNLLTPFYRGGPNIPPLQPVDEILKAAAALRFPEHLAGRKAADRDAAITDFSARLAANPDMPLPHIIETVGGALKTYSREETIAVMMREPEDPPLGDWPEPARPTAHPSVAFNILTGQPFEKVYIGLAPTDDWTTIPAYLRWGNWNDCPAAEHHVAALRAWRDRYGAELVGMNADTIDLRVAERPKTRDEALALAREFYVYCTDIIDQGAQTYSALAASLMANDWWFFWWD